MDNIENVFCGNSALLISYPYFGAKKGTGELYRGQCKETAGTNAYILSVIL